MPSLNSPIITGDVSGGLHSTKVEKLQNNAVAATAPTSGQVLTWDGSQWAPATNSSGGGGGANGLTYYLRQDVAADEPTTNIPGTPKQLGRTGAVAATSVTSGTLTVDVWTLLGGYVSESVPLDPNISAIPGGLWDFNVWALGTANANAATVIRAKAYTYNGTDAPTLLGTSGEQVINNVSAQFSLSVLVPQTTVTSTTRIYVAVEVKAVANNHTATLQFGDGTPSHVHTSLPLVGGTGLWKNVAGVLQSPASLLIDADVDAAAAIAQSKIDGLTAALANVSAPGAYFEFFEQFMGLNSISGNLQLAQTGGTNTLVNSGFGIIAMSTGVAASANQQARINQGATSFLIGNSAARVIFRVAQSGTTWFDGTLTGAFRCGWGDIITAESGNGMYFRVQNGQAIDFVTKATNVETVTSTGVSFLPNAFKSLEILINAAGTQVTAKIDGSTVATHTTNIPTARLTFFTHINRVAATATAVVANVDFIYSRITPNTPYFV
jgi:hypothetical protein